MFIILRSYSQKGIDQLGGIRFKGFVYFFRHGCFVENIEPTILLEQIINTEDTLMVCDVAAVKESLSLPLSLLINSFEVVRLENTDAALINGGHVSVSKKHIGIRNYENGPPSPRVCAK